jgi:spore coat protein CotH
MSVDTSTLLVQLVLLAAIILVSGFIGGVRVRFVPLRSKEQVIQTRAGSAIGRKPEVRNPSSIYRNRLTMHETSA